VSYYTLALLATQYNYHFHKNIKFKLYFFLTNESSPSETPATLVLKIFGV